MKITVFFYTIVNKNKITNNRKKSKIFVKMMITLYHSNGCQVRCTAVALVVISRVFLQQRQPTPRACTCHLNNGDN